MSVDSVGVAPGKIPAQQATSARFTSGFGMGPGGARPLWLSTNHLPLVKGYKGWAGDGHALRQMDISTTKIITICLRRLLSLPLPRLRRPRRLPRRP